MKTIFYIIVFVLFGFVNSLGQDDVKPYFTVEQMPNIINFLPSPPDSNEPSFNYDVIQYMWGKMQRFDSIRSAIAISDADNTLDGIIMAFSEPFGMAISFNETPDIYRLLRDALATCHNICYYPKLYYMRQRPFMRYQEQTLRPDDEPTLVNDGSYPSGHTVLGWSAALLLSEINPDRADTLMARGYTYGESRVIVGAHWQSDVDAGRLASSVAYMKLHTSPEFLDQMEKAKKEFKEKSGLLNVRNVNNENVISDQHTYNLSGLRLLEKPSKGVYIQSGKKYIVNERVSN